MRCVYVACLIALGAAPGALGAPVMPTTPTVDFKAIAASASVERGNQVKVFLAATNTSRIALSDVRASLLSDAFTTAVPPAVPPVLAPYGSLEQTLSIKPTGNAAFGQHKLLFTLSYTWALNGKNVRSAQEAIVDLEVKRHFEEEAKGFPGGTAAFLYLLLPVIPAFLSYDVIERARRGEGLQIPTFRNEYIAFAFLLAVALSFLMVLAAHYDLTVAYSNPALFLSVLFASAVAGAIVPGRRWYVEAERARTWGFTETDTFESYLRKALLGPQAPSDFFWVKGTTPGKEWEGVLLRQPGGVPVLGAQLQVSPRAGLSGDEQSALNDAAAGISGPESHSSRQRLLELVSSHKATLGFQRKIDEAGTRQEHVVVVEGLEDFKQTEAESRRIPFVVAVP